MRDETPQSYASHRRIDPSFHVYTFGILAVNFVIAGVALVRMLLKGTFAFSGLWEVLMASALIVLFFKVRLYALRVQDRVIRLEETLRLQRLLPEGLQARIGDLRPGHFVALRFASDGELSDLVQAALDEKLGKEELKKRIRTWRPDTFRV
jgi:hypothetical protein